MKTTIKAPSGMSGIAVTCWGGQEYAVAADWAQAAAQVWCWSWGEQRWVALDSQVADYRHSPHRALQALLTAAVADSGDTPDDDEIDGIIDGAVEISADEQDLRR